MAGRKHQNPWEKKHKTVGKSATPSSVVAVDQGPGTETEKKTTESSASAAVQERVGSEVKLLGVAATSGSDKETEEERKKRLREADKAARKAKREAKLQAQQADAAGGGGGGGGGGAAAAAAAAATVPAPAPALEPVGPAAAVAAGDFEDDLPIGSGSDDGSIFAGLSDPEAVVEFSDDEF
jgi:hypothetical protein